MTETQKRTPRPKLEFSFVPIEKIEANELNPRRVFPDAELDSLCKSIVRVGAIVVPLIAFKKGDRFVLLDGERRLKAAKRLGMKEVPVNIMPKELSDSDNISEMFTIHKEREEWNPIARAKSLAQLRSLNPGVSDSDLQRISGMSENDIREADLILRYFPEKIQDKALNQHIRGYGIKPAYLAEIARAIDATQQLYPKVIEKYGIDTIVTKLIAKIENRTIKNATHFRLVTDAVRTSSEAQIDEVYSKLVNDKEFTPRDIERIIPSQIRIDHVSELITKSKEFIGFLDGLPLRKSTPTAKRSAEVILKRLLAHIQRKLRQL